MSCLGVKCATEDVYADQVGLKNVLHKYFWLNKDYELDGAYLMTSCRLWP